MSELTPAIDGRDFSRFLVAPLRRIPKAEPRPNPDEKEPERFTIACGLLGGFGGFLDRSFRDHDFQLGRRNCQQFLRNSFLLPADNAVIGGSGTIDLKPIIPLLGTAADTVRLPIWPQMKGERFKDLCARVEQRVAAALPLLINSHTQSVRLRIALKAGWFLFLRRRTLQIVVGTMLADLVRRGQIEEWDAPAPVIKICGGTKEDVQAVLAALIDPTFDFRTKRGIAMKTHLSEEFIGCVLSKLSCPTIPEKIRSWKGPLGYTLYSRRPVFLKDGGSFENLTCGGTHLLLIAIKRRQN